jgi:hypothetical protein
LVLQVPEGPEAEGREKNERCRTVNGTRIVSPVREYYNAETDTKNSRADRKFAEIHRRREVMTREKKRVIEQQE